MKVFASILTTAMLAGCATPKPAGPSGAELLAADPSQACLASNIEQQRQGVLGQKLSFIGQPTLEMLADKTKANEQEKKAISAFSAERQRCIELGSAYRRANLPMPVTLALEEGGSSSTALLAKLYAGDFTFGEYNAARAANSANIQARLVEYDRQANQAQAQASADDAARRQAAANAFLATQQAIQAQQQVSPAPTYQIVQPPTIRTPTTTNCQRWGNQVNCTSY